MSEFKELPADGEIVIELSAEKAGEVLAKHLINTIAADNILEDLKAASKFDPVAYAAAIVKLNKADHTIECIKALRFAGGRTDLGNLKMGLKEAKYAIQAAQLAYFQERVEEMSEIVAANDSPPKFAIGHEVTVSDEDHCHYNLSGEITSISYGPKGRNYTVNLWGVDTATLREGQLAAGTEESVLDYLS